MLGSPLLKMIIHSIETVGKANFHFTHMHIYMYSFIFWFETKRNNPKASCFQFFLVLTFWFH